MHETRHAAKKTIGCVQVIKIALLLVFLIYAWVAVSIFIENEWTNIRTGDKHTVTECYICIEAIIYGFTMVPLLLGLTDKVSDGSTCGSKLAEMIDQAEAIKLRRNSNLLQELKDSHR